MAAPRAYDEVRVRAIAAKPPHRRTGAEDAALRAARDAGFEEADHPRDEGGKFSSGAGGGAAKATAGEKAQVAKVASKDPAKRTPEEKVLLAKHMGEPSAKAPEASKPESKHATHPLPDEPGAAAVYDLDHDGESLETKVVRRKDGSYYADTGEFDFAAPDAASMRDKLKRFGAKTYVGWTHKHDLGE